MPPRQYPVHPGEILLEEYLKPMGMAQTAFARHLKVPPRLINEIIREKRGITPRTARLFAKALGTSAEFWMNLQANFDLAREPEVSVPPLAPTASK